jgi:hypothetical protein
LFTGGLVTNVEHEATRRVLTNVGGQLDFQLTALSTLDMILSVGSAVAFEDGFAPRRELMVSFKVLR